MYLIGGDHDILQDERRDEQELVVGVGVERDAGVGLAQGLADERLEGGPHVQLRVRTRRGRWARDGRC